jgi:hypothetical protein
MLSRAWIANQYCFAALAMLSANVPLVLFAGDQQTRAGDHQWRAILQIRTVLQQVLGDSEVQPASDARVHGVELAVGGIAVAVEADAHGPARLATTAGSQWRRCR